jgi:hypothetical protein
MLFSSWQLALLAFAFVVLAMLESDAATRDRNRNPALFIISAILTVVCFVASLLSKVQGG